MNSIISITLRRFCALQNLRELSKKIRNNNPDLKIVVGAGGIYDEGWISTDKDNLNLLKESDWKRLFTKNLISLILAEHIWEHLTEEDSCTAARNCYRYLRRVGHLRIAVPDGINPDPKYID
jgi:predicted SAM-dependent methyltransferase